MVGDPLSDAVREARRQLALAIRDIDTRGPLPAPNRFVREDDDDPCPGAHWYPAVRGSRRHRDDTVAVIAALDDVGSTDAPVYLRGIDTTADDLFCLPPEEGSALALALLAATQMAGSPLIAKHCRQDPT